MTERKTSIQIFYKICCFFYQEPVFFAEIVQKDFTSITMSVVSLVKSRAASFPFQPRVRRLFSHARRIEDFWQRTLFPVFSFPFQRAHSSEMFVMSPEARTSRAT
jgi:hypothetical protein